MVQRGTHGEIHRSGDANAGSAFPEKASSFSSADRARYRALLHATKEPFLAPERDMTNLQACNWTRITPRLGAQPGEPVAATILGYTVFPINTVLYSKLFILFRCVRKNYLIYQGGRSMVRTTSSADGRFGIVPSDILNNGILYVDHESEGRSGMEATA